MAKDKKLENLARAINSLHNGQGPDLLGLCEIENEDLAKELKKRERRISMQSLTMLIVLTFEVLIHV